MTESHHAPAPADPVNAERPSGEMNGRLILYSAATLAGSIALSIGVAYLLFAWFEGLDSASPDKETPMVAGERGPQPDVLDRTRQPPLEQLTRDPPQRPLSYLQPPPGDAGTADVRPPQGIITQQAIDASDPSVLKTAGTTVPPQTGFQRIPIEQAIKLLAQKDSSLQKHWLPAQARTPTVSPLDQPTQSNSGRGPRPAGRN